MNKKRLFLLLSVLSFTVGAAENYVLPIVDVDKELQIAADEDSGLIKFAITTQVTDLTMQKGQIQHGSWQQLSDGRWQWKLRFSAENAKGLNVGMSDFFLPHSAQLTVSNDDGSLQLGPYGDSDNPKDGFFWVGELAADHLNMAITVDAAEKDFIRFKIDNVPRSFAQPWSKGIASPDKSGSCNVDVACIEGDSWDSEVNSVGRYTFQTSDGGYVCTGQLINNAAQDGQPYFLTADHCGYSGSYGQESLSVRQSVAASISIIWNYQSLTCRTPSSSQSGTSISTSTFSQRQQGASYVASNPVSDMALVLLNQTPVESWNVAYTGWDRSSTIPGNGAVSIHHPRGDAKRIAVENDALTATSYLGTTQGNASHFRITDWDNGTTEGGSSGAGLWNGNHLLIGQLHGGYAACGNDSSDWYGRFYTSWNNGSNSQARLKDWLDPNNSGVMTLQKLDGCSAPQISLNADSSGTIGQNLNFSASVSGGSGSYQYAWDLNGDDNIDSKQASFTASLSHSFSGNIELTVTDSEGCQSTASQALIVQAPEVKVQQVGNLQQICGNNDIDIDPGERWGATVTFNNNSSVVGTDAYAVFGVGNDGSAPAADVVIETPAISLGNLSGSASASFEFAIPTDSSCGSSINIDHQATVFDEGFNAGQNDVINTTIGNNGSCQTINYCEVNSNNNIDPSDGVWWNPQRSGNGTNFFFIQNRLVYVIYTGAADGSPIWYITGGEEQALRNQYFNNLQHISYSGGFTAGGQQTRNTVGWSNTVVLDEQKLIQVRQINGNLSAEKMQPQIFDTTPAVNQYSGWWHADSEAGWGENVVTQGSTIGVIHYVYDQSGQPYWVIGSGNNNNQSINLSYVSTFCSSCPAVSPTYVDAGSSHLQLNAQGSGEIISLDIAVPTENRTGGTWQRQNLPLTNLSFGL